MDALKCAILVALAMTLMGIALVAVPYSGPEYSESSRIEVSGSAGVGHGGHVRLSSGMYEVCVLNLTDQPLNSSNLALRLMRNGKAMDIEEIDPPVTREIDGARCDCVRSFHITFGDSYLYHIFMNGLGEDDWAHFELIFIRLPTRTDQPIYWIGLALVAVGLLGIPSSSIYILKSRWRLKK